MNTLPVPSATITLDDGVAPDSESPDMSVLSAQGALDKVFVRADAPLLIWVFR